jgi:hypothetical protein
MEGKVARPSDLCHVLCLLFTHKVILGECAKTIEITILAGSDHPPIQIGRTLD